MFTSNVIPTLPTAPVPHPPHLRPQSEPLFTFVAYARHNLVQHHPHPIQEDLPISHLPMEQTIRSRVEIRPDSALTTATMETRLMKEIMLGVVESL